MADALAEIERILTDHGPLAKADVVERLRAAGIRDAEDAVHALLNEMSCPAAPLHDGRWVWLPAILSGRVLTHRVDADELAHDLLTLSPDLGPITELCEFEQYERLADGSPVRVVVAEFDDEAFEERGIPWELLDEGAALLLPPGTLAGLGVVEGDLVGVRLTEAGLVLERVAAVATDTDVADRLAAVLPEDEPTSVDEAVWALCVADPTLFTEPLPPLAESVAERGFELHLDALARPGFDFDRWRFEKQCEMLAERHDLTAEDALALRTLISLYEHMADLLETVGAEDDSQDVLPDELSTLVTAAAAVLADDYLAELLRYETVGMGGPPAALGLFAEKLEPLVPRRARVAYRWLLAVALDMSGDVELAERALSAAETMDSEWAPVLIDLARFASDRGDAERALTLLRRAGAGEDHPFVRLLETHRATPRTDVGRNDPCWCGSGRKYKKCHLGREGLPLADRVDWLYGKAYEYVMATPWLGLLDAVAEVLAAHAPDSASAEELAANPLILDSVLFEGGAFEEFLTRRGALLPADERSLAEQWLLVQRSVFEVQEVHRGVGLTLRDVRSGDVVEVRERTASKALKPSELICARVVPVAEGFEIWGGIEPVALQSRNALVELLDSEPDAVELVDFLSGRYASPSLVTTEGEDVALCEATLRVADAVEIGALLDGEFERTDDAPARWIEVIPSDRRKRVRATLELVGDVLTVRTMSAERLDAALATVARLDPLATVLTDERTAVANAYDALQLAKQAAGAPNPDDPEVVAALRDYVLKYEQEWLDEPIPALEGMTPRQAAADPTRRADLITLLASFPAVEEGGTGMDPDRLRAALGL